MLRITDVSVGGYRSLRRISWPMESITIHVGSNGVGKSNLYRSLQLIQASALGNLSHELASEGGMASAIWAGKRRNKEPARIELSVSMADDENPSIKYDYSVCVGFVPQPNGVPSEAAFLNEPQIKEEALVSISEKGRKSTLLERKGPAGFVVDAHGSKQEFGVKLMASETAIGSLVNAARFPDLFLVRQVLSDWRFYHNLRTDEKSPLRDNCIAVASPILSSDGSNLAAVLATVAHIKQDMFDIDELIDSAFPGAQIVIPQPEEFASFGIVFPDHPHRVFRARELSDGTLRFIALLGALHAYRVPPFIALNEPETSLHPELIPALGKMIAWASKHSQIWLVTHSHELAEIVAEQCGTMTRQVIKKDGETWIEGLSLGGEFIE